MGKHYLKCLVCGCEKDDYPEMRFFSFPADERREIWLTNLNLAHLINAKISYDMRVCEKHFSCDMFGKSGYRLKDYATPIKIFEDSQLISPKSTEVTEIGVINNDGFMNQQMPGTSKHALGDELNETSKYALIDKLPGAPNDDNKSLIVPTEHKSIERRIIYVIENEINKLRKECEELRKENVELRKENVELRKEKNSDAFYIERTRRLLPEELARIWEGHISNIQHDHQGWSQHREAEHPRKRTKLASLDEFVLPNSKSSPNKSNEDGEIDIKDEIDIKEEPLDDDIDRDIKPNIGNLQDLHINASNAQSLLEIKPDPDGNDSEATVKSEEAHLYNKSR